MAFTPKFIDLVKNSTTVQGTGTVTLGAALSGFTGFASACVTGDQFYYCIQGIDKPAEREVGRGTFQADGTISRDLALGGPLKNFTIGTKTIALVAAGEWYAKLETLANAPASSGGAPTPLFSAAAGSTIAAPVVAISSAGYSVNGVGEARYIQDAAVNAAYVTANPRTSFRAADGRGFKLCTEQRLTVEMFGAIPNDSSAGAKASNDVAIKTACEHRATSGSAYGSEIHAGPYAYYLGVTLEPEGAFRLVGHSSGHVGGGIAGTAQTRLITPINVCTLRIRANGTDGTGVLAGRVGASDSVIAGISLEQATMGTTATAHGVHMRGTARMEECSFVNIAGNAINIFADSTYADPVTAGAADEWRIINCFVHSCNGHGLYTGGNESNAGYSQGVVFHQVGGCAIFDSSYLPNAHYSPQITGYGNSGEKGIFHLGRLYQLVSPNPALGSTTTPGTNANVWLDLFSATAATALFPQWVSGTVYGLRLPFLIVNQSPIYGAYQENGANIGVSNGLLVGGIPSASNTTSRLGSHSSLGLTNTRGIARYRSNGGSTAPLSAAHIGDEEYVALGALDTANGEDGRSSILTYRISGAGGVPSEYFGLDWLNDRDIRWNAGGRTMATIGGIQTLIAYGRLTPVPGIFTLWDMALGDPVGGSGQRIIGARDVAPTSGYHAQGEFYFNIFNPGSGTLGWSCVTAGTPGTFTPVKFANPFVSGNWSDGTGIYIGDSISAFRLTNFSGQFYLQAGATGGGGGTLNMGGMLGSGVLDVNVTGSLKQAGNQVWHAGNLSAFGTSAAGYAPASGGGPPGTDADSGSAPPLRVNMSRSGSAPGFTPCICTTI